MDTPIKYSFNHELAASQSDSSNGDVNTVLLDAVPHALSANPSDNRDDRNGIDWWVHVESGNRLGVDCKVRRTDYMPKGEDDLALETWSVVERRVVGWTRDPAKKTDYVLWLWKDTGRWVLIPFPMLLAVFELNWKGWRKKYKTACQYTPDRDYHSECVFVPRRELWAEIYRRFGGAA